VLYLPYHRETITENSLELIKLTLSQSRTEGAPLSLMSGQMSELSQNPSGDFGIIGGAINSLRDTGAASAEYGTSVFLKVTLARTIFLSRAHAC
jgi:hypothetical protein